MLKAKEKLDFAGVMIPETEKKYLQDTAKRRGITLTDLMLNGGRLFAEFSDEFFKTMEKISAATKLSIPQVINQIFLVYMAKDEATLKELKSSDTYRLAFQYDEGGLIRGDRLFDLVFNEHLTAIKDLHKRWEKNRKKRPKQELVLNEKDESILSDLATAITQIQASV